MPKRLAPRRIISATVWRSRTPPAAFTSAASPTTDLISDTFWSVAPVGAQPVPVLTSAAPARTAIRLPRTICSSVRQWHSRITLTGVPSAASTTARMSSSTYWSHPDRSMPTLITMSSSTAPWSRCRRASAALVSVLAAPEGKPTTAPAPVSGASASNRTSSGR